MKAMLFRHHITTTSNCHLCAHNHMTVIKICGLRDVDLAQVALDAGANLLGMIMVPGRARTVDKEVATEIVHRVKAKRGDVAVKSLFNVDPNLLFPEYAAIIRQRVVENGPFTVGVFRNQDRDQVFATAKELGLDFIQLHGSEDKLDYFAQNRDLQFGIIPRYVLPQDIDVMRAHFGDLQKTPGMVLPLLDSEAGGEGKTIDWTLVNDLDFGRFVLAGGLTPDNLHSTSDIKHLLGFDVSGGVEVDGIKCPEKITKFVTNGKLVVFNSI